MKTVKLLLIACIASLATFMSCVKTDLVPIDDSAYVDLTFLATADSSGKHKGKLTEIDLATLPAAVKTYITANYSGATIKHAATSESGKYLVHIVLADNSNKRLLFTAAGVFESVKEGGKGKGTKIELSALPAVITDFITKTYTGSTILRAMKSTEGNYGVHIEKADKTTVILGFDKDGKFMNELTHKDKKEGGKGPKKN